MGARLLKASQRELWQAIERVKECSIPDRLCITKETLVPGHPSSSAGSGGVEYDLLATISHHGHSLQNGHYTASVKDHQTGDWFHCDDESTDSRDDGTTKSACSRNLSPKDRSGKYAKTGSGVSGPRSRRCSLPSGRPSHVRRGKASATSVVLTPSRKTPPSRV